MAVQSVTYPPHKSSLGDQSANTMALIAYIAAIVLSWIPVVRYVAWAAPLVIFFLEKKSPLVKFHAMQAGVLYVAETILYTVFNIILISSVRRTVYGLSGGFWLWSFLLTAISIVFTVFAIIAMVKAYKYEKYGIPLIGNLSETLAKTLDKNYPNMQVTPDMILPAAAPHPYSQPQQPPYNPQQPYGQQPPQQPYNPQQPYVQQQPPYNPQQPYGQQPPQQPYGQQPPQQPYNPQQPYAQQPYNQQAPQWNQAGQQAQQAGQQYAQQAGQYADQASQQAQQAGQQAQQYADQAAQQAQQAGQYADQAAQQAQQAGQQAQQAAEQARPPYVNPLEGDKYNK